MMNCVHGQPKLTGHRSFVFFFFFFWARWSLDFGFSDVNAGEIHVGQLDL